MDFNNFEYPNGESTLTASLLLHDDDNSALVRNEEVKYYVVPAQVLAKIILVGSCGVLFLREQVRDSRVQEFLSELVVGVVAPSDFLDRF